MADPVGVAPPVDPSTLVCKPEPLIFKPEPPVCKAPPVAWCPDSSNISTKGTAAPVVALAPPPKPEPTPAPISVMGTTSYYRWRHDDFVKRNPGKTPPDYYLAYGEKYAVRFTAETYKKLSPEGKAWLTKALLNLQVAIEDKRRKDPAAFDKLEHNPKAFRDFCFETHSKAYLDAGLADLPYLDRLKIGWTPDAKDLFSKKGLSQAADVAVKMAYDDLISDPIEAVTDAGKSISRTVRIMKAGPIAFGFGYRGW